MDEAEIRDLQHFQSLFRRVGWAHLVIYGGAVGHDSIEFVFPRLSAWSEFLTRLISFRLVYLSSDLLVYYPVMLAVAAAPLAQWAWNVRGIPKLSPRFTGKNTGFVLLTAFLVSMGAPLVIGSVLDALLPAIGLRAWNDPAFELLSMTFGLALMLGARPLVNRLVPA